MKSLDTKFKLPVAVKNRSKIDLSNDHYTTNDFFRLKPVYITEVVPGDDIKMKLHTLSRTMALKKPFYGKVEFINRAFFVPMRTICSNWNEFITDTGDNLANRPSYTPYFTNQDLVRVFFEHGLITVTTSTKFDISIYDPDLVASLTHYNFTRKGKICYDILRNLGYKIGFAQNTTADGDKLNALPFLAFYRIYNDWLQNPAYAGLHDSQLKYAGQVHLTHDMIYSMLERVNFALYEKDYFTSAWQKPVGPNSSNSISAVDFSDVSNDRTSNNTYAVHVKSSTSPSATKPTTPSLTGTASDGSTLSTNTPFNITQYALDRLKQLTDYCKRFQLVGERVIDRYKALFGVDLTPAKLDRSQYLGMTKMDMQVGEVMVTADTQDAVTGDYAGRSAGYGQGEFTLKSDEFGYFIVISFVRPHIGYFQGRPRFVNHINRNDFFNPTFDGCGVQPIRIDELMADYMTEYSQQRMNDVFGFTSVYGEYKCNPHDCLSGDFVINSKNTGLDAFYLLRKFGEQDTPELNEAFTIGNSQQFNRIFYENSGDYDQFITVYHCEVTAWRNMTAMFEDYSFDGGRLISQEIGGTSLE